SPAPDRATNDGGQYQWRVPGVESRWDSLPFRLDLPKTRQAFRRARVETHRNFSKNGLGATGAKDTHPGSVHGVITSLFMRSVIASGVLPRKSMPSLLLLHIGTQQDLVDGPGDLDDWLGRRRVDANPVPTHDLAADADGPISV